MVIYLEKFGGYGACRELEMIRCSLAHIFDCALNDLAYQLTLLEEPPNQIWSYRPVVTQSRRVFAPLCPHTVALAHAKEVDFIQNRKAEMNKKAFPSQEGPAKFFVEISR